MYAELEETSGGRDTMAFGNDSTEGGFVTTHYHGIPNSASHVAEQMESGGARIEEALERFNCRYQSLFFVASLLVTFAAFLALAGSIFTVQLANIVNSTFLLMFGTIMLLLDVPGSPRWTTQYRSFVRKYVRFLTRLTGKALWFLFLGCLSSSALWPSKRGGNGLLLLAVVIGFIVVTISVIGMLLAIRRSLRLERVRKSILSTRNSFAEVYQKYALTDPHHGMQFEEFNRLCSDYTSGKVQFEITDLGIIYNALDDHQKCAINEREFISWMAGPMTHV